MSKINVSASLLALVIAAVCPGCDDGAAPSSPASNPAPSSAESTTASAAESTPPKVRVPSYKADPRSRVPSDDPILLVLSEPDAYQRIERLAALLRTLGPEGVASAQALLNGLADGSHEFGVGECALLIHYWTSHDAEAAGRWALFNSPRAYRSGVLVPGVVGWAKEDPQAAAAVVQEFVSMPGLHTEMAELALVWGWFDSRKPGLVEYIQERGPSYQRQRMLAALAKRMIQQEGAEATASWVDGLPDEDKKFKLMAYRQTGKALGRAAPSVAAAWCEAQCDGPFGDGVHAIVAQHWGWRDGAPAMEWVSKLPPGEVRDAAVKGAFRGWWPIDREAFMSWTSELERDGIPDWFQPTIELYASGLARKVSAKEGLRWASLVEDEATRERTTINVARIWRNVDAAGVDAWLESSPLSEEARESVRNPVPGRGFKEFPAPQAP